MDDNRGDGLHVHVCGKEHKGRIIVLYGMRREGDTSYLVSGYVPTPYDPKSEACVRRLAGIIRQGVRGLEVVSLSDILPAKDSIDIPQVQGFLRIVSEALAEKGVKSVIED